MAYENKGAFAATVVVAASDSLNKGAANYVCLGAADEVIIQEALNALPASGGEVLLLEGTYQCAASIVMDSYQILRGCGRGTILTASAADVDIITATGGAGTEKVGMLITTLCIDGNAGGSVNDIGILWTYVDRSRIEGCWILDNGEDGIKFDNCDDNKVTDNFSNSNTQSGIFLQTSLHNSVKDNSCQSNTTYGIHLAASLKNNILGNTCQGNTQNGILVEGTSPKNNITGNTCADNGYHGIVISESNQNVVTSNQCDDNGAAATYHGIYVYRSSYCTVTGNICNNNLIDGINVTGDATTNSDYNTLTGNVCYNNGDDGIEIAGGADAVKNIVLGNQLLGNTGTALVDGGTNTEKAHNIEV